MYPFTFKQGGLMADYWIKAYIEILDDPKMATMPDRLWRRAMEMFLLAGRYSKEKSGHLPDTNQLAWALRMTSDELLLDMKQLETARIVKKTKDGWQVINFEKRQAASTAAERKRQQREREQREQYYGNITSQSRNVTQINRNRLTETETETEEATAATVFDAYMNNIGQLSPIMSEKLQADIDEYSTKWVLDAIEKAVVQEKRSLGYVEGILKGWKRDGKGTEKPAENRYESAKVYDE
jgi:DnaD/phage-associated family protein